VNETICLSLEADRKQTKANLLAEIFEGRLDMIALKVIAVAIGAGVVLSMYFGDLGADVVLAIMSCLA